MDEAHFQQRTKSDRRSIGKEGYMDREMEIGDGLIRVNEIKSIAFELYLGKDRLAAGAAWKMDERNWSGLPVSVPWKCKHS